MEMLDVIPPELQLSWYLFWIKKLPNEFEYEYYVEYAAEFNSYPFEWTLPNALAEMVLWLHSNSHITFDNPTQWTN